MNNLLNIELNIAVYGKSNVGKTTFCKKFIINKESNLFPIGHANFHERKMSYYNFSNVDVALLIIDYAGLNNEDINLLMNLNKYAIPTIVLINKYDKSQISSIEYNKIIEYSENIIETSTNIDETLSEKVVEELIKILPSNVLYNKQSNINKKFSKVMLLTKNLFSEVDNVVYPQMYVLKDLLSKNIEVSISSEYKLLDVIEKNSTLFIVDSPSMSLFDARTLEKINISTFSAYNVSLLCNNQIFFDGTNIIESLCMQDKILVVTSEKQTEYEIKYLKEILPKYLKNEIEIVYKPKDNIGNVFEYKMIILSDFIIQNRKEILSLVYLLSKYNIPVTTSGLLISYCLGMNKLIKL